MDTEEGRGRNELAVKESNGLAKRKAEGLGKGAEI